ncbi:hypothetical protein [Candidatus Palauibacter sp.]|uniref:hypothetical protein n=1 Tax=Candidatus Palauibacter sp. TaxID=3101350 RepID=UPI003C70100F
MKRIVVCLAIGGLLLACERVVHAPWAEPYETLAVIEGRDAEEYPVVVTVPDSVETGEWFIVSVRTYVDSPCDSKGRTQVENREARARVVVYSLIGVAGNCVRTRIREHTAELKLTESGIGRVVVVGFSQIRGVVQDEYTILVR